MAVDSGLGGLPALGLVLFLMIDPEENTLMQAACKNVNAQRIRAAINRANVLRGKRI